MIQPRPSFLSDPALTLLLFGGKGGVGKTTCAAAAALLLARSDPGKRLLLVSTDPAHSLQDSLGSAERPSNLTVLELDAAVCLERFRQANGGHLRQIALRGTFLSGAEIDRFVGLSLPGLDELMAFLEITSLLESGTYARIVVDTAPTGHTLRLLAMPALTRQWLRALDALLAKHRYMRKVFSGRTDPDEPDIFLENLATSVRKVAALLSDSAVSCFVPVLLAERLSIAETDDLLLELARRRIPVRETVVNRLRPEAGTCPVCAGERARQDGELVSLCRSTRSPRPSLWGLPIHPGEVRGPGLETFWDSAFPISEPAVAPSLPSRSAPPVQRSLSLPPLSLLVVAGKGGVGKTTVACSLALRLAQARPGARVLVVSADPAHSLADALEVSAGPVPAAVTDGVWSLEIDAAGAFSALRRKYEDEVRLFLGRFLKGVDLVFDRDVLERLLDLSPPGLDEVMAVSEVMELLAGRRFDVVVLDAAPTGHLVRLLEAPELIDGWLRAFFELLLRYRKVVRLPSTTRALVTLSRNLKALRGLLADPARAGLLAVAIPTEMALAETEDLLAACGRLGVAVHGLVLNLVSPAVESCALCSARASEDERLSRRFEETFPSIPTAVVFRGGDPRAVPALRELGLRLFAEAPDD